MSKEVDYSSDSDQSDEDFCPENAGILEQLSEEDTDDEIEESENGAVSAKKINKLKVKKQKKDTSNDNIDSSSVEKRNTRQKANSNNAHEKSIVEKDELESDGDEKSRTDALWADFLSDVKVVPKKENTKITVSSSKPTSSSTKTKSTLQIKSSVEEPKLEKQADEPAKKTLTELLNFAGEDVVVQKEVNADSIKENSVGSGSKSMVKGMKRFAPGGSGISSIINQIGKKKKMSVLEKSKLDWNSYKQDEGLDDEIKTFNKGKDGFLERQDFLQRTDLRQFEIERNLRQSRRNK